MTVREAKHRAFVVFTKNMFSMGLNFQRRIFHIPYSSIFFHIPGKVESATSGHLVSEKAWSQHLVFFLLVCSQQERCTRAKAAFVREKDNNQSSKQRGCAPKTNMA